MPGLHDMFSRFWSSPAAKASPRVAYDAFLAMTPPAPGVALHPSTDPLLPGWICAPEDPVDDQVLLYLHGGAYVLGTAPAYRSFVSQIASRARRTTFILEYPLAPETALPTAIELAAAALDHLALRFKVGVVGDSAGGGLTLATLARTTRASAAVVFSPWTDLTFSGASMRGRAARERLLDEDMLRNAARGYIGSTSAHDPRASPLLGIPARLPPLLIQVGSEEILHDDSVRYAQRAHAAGHDVTLQQWTGMHHVFQLDVEQLEGARQALDAAAAFIDRHMT
ncbi:alpha/beta hydrolase fold domain-containing protein [Nannocystis radixulma]|uniref:Alpha/beta hydrolase fold domain-containing protein n=1 Tax=Nannocystis radixulma TaxID=2995305 RepID=A0ABT5B2D5_9BACT|nr:alpha/beta hydrolase fold domain-containing protein [Nannocystis radixulma]MDC0668266.1 alpha/beta hydrolase fold domain-containing protein [Nannocystis radixulma]